MPRRILRLAPSHSHSPPHDETWRGKIRAKLRLRALNARVGHAGPHTLVHPLYPGHRTATAFVVHLLPGH